MGAKNAKWVEKENCLHCHRSLLGALELKRPTSKTNHIQSQDGGASPLKPSSRQRLGVGCLEGGGLTVEKGTPFC